MSSCDVSDSCALAAVLIAIKAAIELNVTVSVFSSSCHYFASWLLIHKFNIAQSNEAKGIVILM